MGSGSLLPHCCRAGHGSGSYSTGQPSVSRSCLPESGHRRPLAGSTPWLGQMEQPAPPLPAVGKQQGVAAVVPGPQWPSRSGICAHRGHSHWFPPASGADPPQQRSNAMDHQRAFWRPAGGQSIGHRLAAHRVGCPWGNNRHPAKGRPPPPEDLPQGSLKWCPLMENFFARTKEDRDSAIHYDKIDSNHTAHWNLVAALLASR